jgi:SAM-dependent methyltransferase
VSSAGAQGIGALPGVDELLSTGDAKACCSALYEHPAVRWLLGDELHPGGVATTRRALELIGLAAGERLLDVASGTGASAVLAAREFGSIVTGIDYGTEAVGRAQSAADAACLRDQVAFIVGDAEALPYGEGEFDAVLCECSVCTFPDKARAIAEMCRVLRPGGRVAISDVVVDPERLPAELIGPLATIGCVGSALPVAGYQELLVAAGLRPIAVESHGEDAAAFAGRVEDRLRGARLLGLDRAAGSPIEIRTAIELVAIARRAISEGALGYAILTASR